MKFPFSNCRDFVDSIPWFNVVVVVLYSTLNYIIVSKGMNKMWKSELKVWNLALAADRCFWYIFLADIILQLMNAAQFYHILGYFLSVKVEKCEHCIQRWIMGRVLWNLMFCERYFDQLSCWSIDVHCNRTQ